MAGTTVDELLEMSRSMAKRLDELQQNQEQLINRLSRRVLDLKGALGAAEQMVRV